MPNQDEERIEVVAILRDELSRPADKAADKIEHLGDEAEKSGKQLDEFGQSADDAAKKTDELSKSTDKNTKVTKENTHWQQQARDEKGRFIKAEKEAAKAVDDSTKKLDKHSKAVKNSEKSLLGLIKTTLKFGKLWTFIKWGSIADGATFLGKALYGLGAAGYAAVAGLSPLSGALVAYPGLFAAAAQGLGVMKIATMGLTGAVQVLEKRRATYAEIWKALHGMGRNEVLFAQSIADTKKETRGLRKELGNRFFAGLSHDVIDLSHKYFPILNKELGATATQMNHVAEYTAAWVGNRKQMANIQALMGSQAKIVGNLGFGGSASLRGLLWLLQAAQPMLRAMSQDMANLGTDFADWTQGHQKQLRGFFDYSYKELKYVLGVIGDFGMGLYNIGKYSKEMSHYLGTSFAQLGKNFEGWTKSAKGEREIKTFFHDMIPVVHELGMWVHDLAVDIDKSVMKTPTFLKLSQGLRTNILPALTNLLQASSGSFGPLWVDLGKLINDIAAAGVTSATVSVLDDAVWLLGSMINLIDKLPKPLRDTVFQMGALFSVLKFTGLLGLVKGLAGAGKGLAAGKGVKSIFGDFMKTKPMPVEVMNWPPGFGGAAGGAAGEGETLGKDAAIAGGASMTSRILTSLRAIGTVSPEGIAAAGSSLADWLGTRTVQQRSSLAMQNISGGLFPNAPGGQPLAKGKWWNPWATRWGSDDAAYLDKSLAGRVGKNPTATLQLLNQAANKENIPITALIASLPMTAKAIAQINDIATKGIGNLNSTIGETSRSANQLLKIGQQLGESTFAPQVGMRMLPSYNQRGSAAAFRGMNFYADGGITQPGIAMVGERGPEAFVDRMGNIGMVGVNGPEILNIGAGAVVPASATADPFHGSTGRAPEWAVDALRKAAGGSAGGSLVPGTGSGSQSQPAPYTGPAVVIENLHATSNVDVQGSVYRAMKQAEEDRLNRS